MPKIVKHTPRWLSRPSPGFKLFSDPATHGHTSNGRETNGTNSSPVPSRKIACRGTEVFIVVHNELRWSDLVLLKELHDEKPQEDEHDEADDERRQSYKVLKVPIFRNITRLVISPLGDYLAILTSHTIHIVILPDSTHLSSGETGPLRLKTFQVGPTQHVLDQPSLVSALWHPLGLDGSCLVTVNEHAVVRLWEFDRHNRMSVNDPALAIDLRRLANGTSSREDFSPSPSKSIVFSPDAFDMEVAAACFGGMGHANEVAWASMTLWVAMRGGDVYALCPMLPSRFCAPQRLVNGLAKSISQRCDNFAADSAASKDMMRSALHQLSWVAELVEQEHTQDGAQNVFIRPTHPSGTPMLQGPFHVEPDTDTICDVTDIFAFAASESWAVDTDGPTDPEEEQDIERGSVGSLCIGTSDSRIHICFDTNRTDGRWLPAKKTGFLKVFDDGPLPGLLLLDSMQLGEPCAECWPLFTQDPCSRLSVFVTHSDGVMLLSIADWMQKLNEELSSPGETGSLFRLKLVVEGTQAKLDHVLRADSSTSMAVKHGLTDACVALYDSDLGHFILTRATEQPHASQLGGFEQRLLKDSCDSDDFDEFEEIEDLYHDEERETYQQPQEFWTETTLHAFAAKYISKEPRRSLKDHVKISGFDLNLMTVAHHVLSQETHRLNEAVSGLFGRCERLQSEFAAQIERGAEVANQIDSVLDDDADVLDEEGRPLGSSENINRRLTEAHDRQEALSQRYEDLRQKMSQLDRRPLKDKERPWMDEIQALGKLAGGEEADADGVSHAHEEGSSLTDRHESMRSLKEELVNQATELAEAEAEEDEPKQPHLSQSRSRTANVERMLQKETAMIETVKAKLAELGSMI